MQSEKVNIKDKNCTVKVYVHLKTQPGSYLLLKAGTSRVMDGELLLRSFPITLLINSHSAESDCVEKTTVIWIQLQ